MGVPSQVSGDEDHNSSGEITPDDFQYEDEIDEEPKFTIEDDDIVVKSSVKSSTDADHEYLEQKMNQRKEQGLIEVKEVEDGVFLAPTEKALTQDQPVTILSSGENSISSDQSPILTPWNTHEVKLDEDLTFEVQQLLLINAGVSSFAGVLSGKFGAPGLVVSALAGAIALKSILTENELDRHREPDGVEFTFYFADTCIDVPIIPDPCIAGGPLEQVGLSYLTAHATDISSQ
ncbi:hypothetical protein [Halostagnicola bangensis]